MHTKKDRLAEERRGSVRHSHTYPISFTTLGNSHNLPNKVEKPAETIDISNYGMRIRTSVPSVREGSMMRLRINMPGIEASVPVMAEVKWIKEKAKSYDIGLRFILL
jgi:hypothetical protein